MSNGVAYLLLTYVAKIRAMSLKMDEENSDDDVEQIQYDAYSDISTISDHEINEENIDSEPSHESIVNNDELVASCDTRVCVFLIFLLFGFFLILWSIYQQEKPPTKKQR